MQQKHSNYKELKARRQKGQRNPREKGTQQACTRAPKASITVLSRKGSVEAWGWVLPLSTTVHSRAAPGLPAPLSGVREVQRGTR